VGTGRLAIILPETLPNLVRGNTDDRIVAGIVIVGPFENGNSICSFFQLRGISGESLDDHMIQKALAAAALREDRSLQDAVQFDRYRRLKIVAERGRSNPLPSDLVVPGGISRRIPLLPNVVNLIRFRCSPPRFGLNPSAIFH